MKPPILYVEDDENDAFFMRLAFERSGLDVNLNIVTDGQQAIDYLSGNGEFADRQQHPMPCVVILDLNLPYWSGLEVLAWIRAQPILKDLPVVLFTASDQPRDRERAQELGADDFVTKPSLPTDLADFVRKINDRWLVTCQPCATG
jgi:CheY-like chemotaxis protein